MTDNPLYLSAYQNGYDYVLNPDGSVDSDSPRYSWGESVNV
ncbi:hypothetical protein Q0F98_38320 [Paenibacillus amylolyticus]|nr:hypothetical protein Q0F98_38320 [Paenibacillus amylolyticus]